MGNRSKYVPGQSKETKDTVALVGQLNDLVNHLITVSRATFNMLEGRIKALEEINEDLGVAGEDDG